MASAAPAHPYHCPLTYIHVLSRVWDFQGSRTPVYPCTLVLTRYVSSIPLFRHVAFIVEEMLAGWNAYALEAQA